MFFIQDVWVILFRGLVFSEGKFITKFINKYGELAFKKGLFIVGRYLRTPLLGGTSLKS